MQCASISAVVHVKSPVISAELEVPWESIDISPKELTRYDVCDEITLLSLSSAEVEDRLQSFMEDDETALSHALSLHTDLLPHVYEGGLKVWECAVDLVKFLVSQDISFSSLMVLELGCGAGLPGLFAMLKGAVVHFQDYNADVLRQLTVPNVAVNARERLKWPPSCRFFAGDWSGLVDVITSTAGCMKYDIILTSETVYSQESYSKLHDLMKSLLKDDGTIYLAAKTCYFGVGGGTQDFANYVDSCGVFGVKVVKSINIGVQRDILRLTFKH